MRTGKLTCAFCCTITCGWVASEVEARGPGARGGYGAIRYSGVYRGYVSDEQPWNAGFNTPPSDPRVDPWKDNRSVATVNPATVYPTYGSGGGANRIETSPVRPPNLGSIQNSGGDLSPGGTSGTPVISGANPSWVLKKMSDYLAAQQQVSLWITETSDRASESGEKFQLSSQQVTYVQRPDRLAVDVSTDKARTRIVYDGSGVTVIDMTKNLYGVIPAQGPVDSVLDMLARQYGMAVSADDLLYKGAYSRLEGRIRVAQDLGVETLYGQPCYHLAFIGDNVDFQIWVQSGDEPMPRKVLIVYRNAPGRPRCQLDITRWDVGAISSSVFNVEVPTGARQIKILPRQ